MLLALALCGPLVAYTGSQQSPPQSTSSSSLPPAAASAPGPDALEKPASTGVPLERDPVFLEGVRYYMNFEFEKACFRFHAASRNTAFSVAELARAEAWLGLAQAQAGDDAWARETFVSALHRDASVVLPTDAPPTVIAIFDEARTAAANGAVPESDSAATQREATARGGGGPVRRPGNLALMGLGVAGSGIVVGIAGAIIGGVALAQAADANKQKFQSDAAKAFAQAQGTAALANVVIVVGGLAAAVGTGVSVAAPFME